MLYINSIARHSDLQVYLVEVSLFPITYVGYVVAVLTITIFRVSDITLS